MNVVRAVGSDKVITPEAALDLWGRGALRDLLRLPDDGGKVEIIDGVIVVTPAPFFGHAAIAALITKAIVLGGRGRPYSSWEVLRNSGVLAREVSGGYVPDLIVMDASRRKAAVEANARWTAPDEIELVAEIATGPAAVQSRRSAGTAATTAKRRGYARLGIPYHLLVDRDPEIARATLYSIPDRSAGAYLHEESWAFGETIRLPEPFALEIPTDLWRPWD